MAETLATVRSQMGSKVILTEEDGLAVIVIHSRHNDTLGFRIRFKPEDAGRLGAGLTAFKKRQQVQG